MLLNYIWIYVVAHTLVARRNVSVEKSYSASIGFSEDVVSAELGFDVTMSEVNEAEDILTPLIQILKQKLRRAQEQLGSG